LTEQANDETMRLTRTNIFAAPTAQRSPPRSQAESAFRRRVLQRSETRAFFGLHLEYYGRHEIMEIDKDKIVTQDELDEPAPIDQVEDRVEAEMKEIEGRAKERVAQGLQDEDLEREARKLKDEGKRELDEARKEQD
jgi:hypothetical protein